LKHEYYTNGNGPYKENTFIWAVNEMDCPSLVCGPSQPYKSLFQNLNHRHG